MSKQTAVQWLLQAIEDKNGAEFASYYREFIQQALQIEKEQIENAYWDGGEDVPANVCRCEQYYVKTYKTE